MFVPRRINKGDLIEVKYRGQVYAGPVRYVECSKVPGGPGYDFSHVDFINASTGNTHNWKPDVDVGAELRRVTYSTPICPNCDTSRNVCAQADGLWACFGCDYLGGVEDFIVEDAFGDNEPELDSAKYELTDAQVERQDCVDNLIYDLLVQLNPGETEEIDWDIEVIAEVREVLCDYFVRKGLTTEQEFYPYVEIESAAEPVDDMPSLEALGLVLDLARQNVIDDPELADERRRQERAIEALEKLL